MPAPPLPPLCAQAHAATASASTNNMLILLKEFIGQYLRFLTGPPGTLLSMRPDMFNQDFHFAFQASSQYTPRRLRWGRFFILSIPVMPSSSKEEPTVSKLLTVARF
jgi:hypothetical protein